MMLPLISDFVAENDFMLSDIILYTPTKLENTAF